MKSFPKPLCDEEEYDIIRRCSNGDKEARDILIERNLRLVVHIVKRYFTSDRDLDDLISIGTIGLIKAIDSYNTDKNIKLATYASKCIDNELLMFLRNSRKQSREVYLHEPIGCDKEGNEISLLDIIESSEKDVVEDIMLQENIKKLYDIIKATLTERELKIITMRYGLYGSREVTQREVASELNISRSFVSRIEKKALLKLREGFGRNG